jgi:hypothetical protein
MSRRVSRDTPQPILADLDTEGEMTLVMRLAAAVKLHLKAGQRRRSRFPPDLAFEVFSRIADTKSPAAELFSENLLHDQAPNSVLYQIR